MRAKRLGSFVLITSSNLVGCFWILALRRHVLLLVTAGVWKPTSATLSAFRRVPDQYVSTGSSCLFIRLVRRTLQRLFRHIGDCRHFIAVPQQYLCVIFRRPPIVDHPASIATKHDDGRDRSCSQM